MKIHATGLCSLCNKDDTIQHFFIHCDKTLIFWKSFYTWWNSFGLFQTPGIGITNILFGYPEITEFASVLNYMLLIAKYHIYKQKQATSHPFFPQFLIELNNQLNVDENISRKNDNLSDFTDKYELIYHSF